jgi:DNA-directed RNA polymerase specialized sigma24 family protein
MSSDFSVTTLLKRLPDESAARRLYQQFVTQVVEIASKKLGTSPRRMSDGEDVAQTVFAAFFRGVREGRFVDLNDRHDLWQVLFMLTERKAVDARRRHFSLKRGGGRVLGESAFTRLCDSGDLAQGLAAFPAPEPDAQFALAAAENVQRLLALLPDDELRRICVWKMEGFTNQQIAEKVGRVTRTVENKLRLIRKCWIEAGDGG